MLLVTSPLFGPAIQLRIERRHCSFSWLLHSEVTVSRSGFTPFMCWSLGSSRLSTFEDVLGARFLFPPSAGQGGWGGRGGGRLKSTTASSSTSSDSQDSVGVRHRFLSLRTIGSAMAIAHSSVQRFPSHHRDMLYKKTP